MMAELFTRHSDALLVGAVAGAVYYVAARAMEMFAVRRSPRASVSLLLAGFGLRMLVAGIILWGLVALTDWHAGALCLGFMTAYTVILFGECVRLLRGLVPGQDPRPSARKGAGA